MADDLKNILSNKVEVTEEQTKKSYEPSQGMKDIMQMVENERSTVINKSWSKIDRSNKLVLLENFIEREIEDKSLDEKESKILKILLTKALNSNLLNKQSDIKYDSVQNIILEITILKYNTETKTYEIVTKNNNVKVTPKTRSKTNIDKLLNNSKKRR